jgi:hypothetical protein
MMMSPVVPLIALIQLETAHLRSVGSSFRILSGSPNPSKWNSPKRSSIESTYSTRRLCQALSLLL